ncbi:MAG: type II secretion system minor pseudopilin GspI [Halieaceae bacterium]|jgi:general secretion pathway protein I|nr:type II secretion system minor pseudopilin GspI [Halieaceae bacterium]MBT5208867.1 type II secretion system minor pseudopilin GspI [Halieaceae bacterium]MBT6265105.1 type II secretion system minor pseudopilin GspI [Halieaceae bacterium]MDG1493505.1 type II secretion system minor pseudopilin GspI [Luminiphilus sp.]MDG2493999.1 type II secretion system minor pseudopilin GspI [Luminiphilus sp.]
MLINGKPAESSGFTLVEVMVALAIVAIAVPALLFALFQQLDGTEYLRDRSIASWIATDRMSELRLVVAKQGAVPKGELLGETRLAERDWYWWIEQQATEIPGFIRVDVKVSLEAERTQPLHTLTAFVTPGVRP